MDTHIGTSSESLEFLRELEKSPYKYDFFTVMRRLECMYSEYPRFGEGARPINEPVRLEQEPSMAFAPSALAEFKAGDKNCPHRLANFFFGLFGPNGPMPLHLTEFARDRQRNENDQTFRKFADIFHHRLTLLFYRAWANGQPTVSFDRKASRRIDTYVGSLIGLGAPEFRNRDNVPDDAKFHQAGRLALQTKPVEGLLAILEQFFALPFRIFEFSGEWLRLASADWLRLGYIGNSGILGKDAVIGKSVWSCQHKFRLVCGPLRLEDFNRLLPGQPGIRRLRDAVRGYVGFAVDWDLKLVLAGTDVPPLTLGESGNLGWTTWLGHRKSAIDAEDVIVRPNADELKTTGPQ